MNNNDSIKNTTAIAIVLIFMLLCVSSVWQEVEIFMLRDQVQFYTEVVNSYLAK